MGLPREPGTSGDEVHVGIRFWRPAGEEWQRPVPPAEVTLRAIAFVRNEVSKPRPRGWDEVESTLEFAPGDAALIAGIERYSHVIVTFYMDAAASAPEKPAKLELAGIGTFGIFATRSQLRPNHLGVSVVAALGREGPHVRVRGLDAIDGTPVLDIKPYLAAYDARAGATGP